MESEVIASRLAREGVAVIDYALGAEHARALRSECMALGKKPATIATGARMDVDEHKRDDVVAWLNDVETPAVQRHKAVMEGLREALESRLDYKMDRATFVCAEYAAGSRGYVKHRDAAPTRPSGRKVTAIYYMNDWSVGGELLVWPGPIKIAPLADRLVVFRSSLEHQVLPTTATRLALTAWFYNRLELGLELLAEAQKEKQLLE